MTAYTQTIQIAAPPAKVFRAYVEKINQWWPWQGKEFRFSFAPEGVEPSEIHFEPKLGGRYYERFADGSEFDIGRVTRYEPPHKFAFTWTGRDWPEGESLFELTFEEAKHGTLLTLIHSGFEIFGDDAAEMVQGYDTGSKEILGAFINWLEAN